MAESEDVRLMGLHVPSYTAQQSRIKNYAKARGGSNGGSNGGSYSKSDADMYAISQKKVQKLKLFAEC